MQSCAGGCVSCGHFKNASSATISAEWENTFRNEQLFLSIASTVYEVSCLQVINLFCTNAVQNIWLDPWWDWMQSRCTAFTSSSATSHSDQLGWEKLTWFWKTIEELKSDLVLTMSSYIWPAFCKICDQWLLHATGHRFHAMQYHALCSPTTCLLNWRLAWERSIAILRYISWRIIANCRAAW